MNGVKIKCRIVKRYLELITEKSVVILHFVVTKVGRINEIILYVRFFFAVITVGKSLRQLQKYCIYQPATVAECDTRFVYRGLPYVHMYANGKKSAQALNPISRWR